MSRFKIKNSDNKVIGFNISNNNIKKFIKKLRKSKSKKLFKS